MLPRGLELQRPRDELLTKIGRAITNIKGER